ncbi:MAG: hypothetical protein VKL00_08270 [Synechococcales bacterium]|nr:hypothetical protein [Cyanobacteria bacterium REEB444]MEB3125605.1 hypothetical protein [Synechococcales bacterium]
MLVIFTDNQILSTQTICHNCPLADQNGQPRWRQGVLQCGHPLNQCSSEQHVNQYECQMGFLLVYLTLPRLKDEEF